MQQSTIEDAQEALTKEVMSLPEVSGTAIGELDGRPCITVFVVRRTRELVERIPHTYRGHPVVVEELGEVQAQE